MYKKFDFIVIRFLVKCVVCFLSGFFGIIEWNEETSKHDISNAPSIFNLKPETAYLMSMIRANLYTLKNIYRLRVKNSADTGAERRTRVKWDKGAI